MSQNLIRKYSSAIKYRVIKTYLLIQSFLIGVVTDKHWLLDWVPTSRTDHQSVMIVRLDVIGDFILWLDSARAYRKLFPNKKIVLYANAIWVDLARQFTHWDEVVSIDMVKLRADECYRLTTFYRIRRRGFSTAIHPTYSREYMADMLTRSSGADEIIGLDGDLSNISFFHQGITNTWYTNLIKSTPNKLMELKRNAEFVRELGLKSFESAIPKIHTLETLPDYLVIKVPYVVVFPGASWVPKMWPSHKFAVLIRELNAKFAIQVILCGSNTEFNLCQEIILQSGVVNAQNFAGKTTLIQLIEVIRSANFVFANDTSAIHIAAATRTPAVCTLGGGHFGRFLPYSVEQAKPQHTPVVVTHEMNCFGCNWNCKYLESDDGTVPCVQNILVEDVMREYAKAK